MKVLYTVLIFTLLIGCKSMNNDTSIPPPSIMRILVLGDWGRYGQYAQKQVAQQMNNTAKNEPIDFVIATGDNFYEDGVKDLNDPHWQQSYEQIYTGDKIQKDWFVILGNHDYSGNPTAELNYHQINKRWNMPSRYYTFAKSLANNTSVRFIFLDTTPFINEHRNNSAKHSDILNQNTNAQLKWLDSTLYASKETWKIVIGHHPIYSAGTGRGNQPEMIDLIKPLLEKYKVQLYIAGHSHNSQYIKRPDSKVDYMVAAAGAYANDMVRPNPDLLFGTNQPSFSMLTITPTSLKSSIIDTTGTVVFHKEIIK